MSVKIRERYLIKGATAIIGNGYGGEGKSKIFSFLGSDFQYLVRSSCEKGEGKMLTYNGKELILKIIPVGILETSSIVVLGPDTHIDLKMLTRDLVYLNKCGIQVNPARFRISDQAKVALPANLHLEEHEELQVRIIDLQNETYEEKIRKACELSGDNDFQKIYDQCMYICTLYKNNQQRHLNQYVCNTQALLNTVVENGYEVLIECPQSYHPTITGQSPSYPMGSVLPIGVGSLYVKRVIGVFKAYSTMIGDGVFPTEFFDMKKLIIQDLGKEYEENYQNVRTSDQSDEVIIHGEEPEKDAKKPRRCGWLDLVQLKHCIIANSENFLAMTGLDTLGTLGNMESDIKVCIAYLYKSPVNGTTQKLTYVPTDMENVEPIYSETTFDGWHIQPNTHNFEDLPSEAQRYVQFVEEYLQMPISFIGVGPDDEDLIVR